MTLAVAAPELDADSGEGTWPPASATAPQIRIRFIGFVILGLFSRRLIGTSRGAARFSVTWLKSKHLAWPVCGLLEPKRG